MADDGKRLDEFKGMKVGELIHTMLCEFCRENISDDPECEGTFLQNENYYWAAERLNDLFDAEAVK